MTTNDLGIVFIQDHLDKKSRDFIINIHKLAIRIVEECAKIPNREMAKAMNSLEESMMWMQKAVCVRFKDDKNTKL